MIWNRMTYSDHCQLTWDHVTPPKRAGPKSGPHHFRRGFQGAKETPYLKGKSDRETFGRRAPLRQAHGALTGGAKNFELIDPRVVAVGEGDSNSIPPHRMNL